MDCVSGDVLLKKWQYYSCKIIILATKIAVNDCVVDIKFATLNFKQNGFQGLVASAADYFSHLAYYSKTSGLGWLSCNIYHVKLITTYPVCLPSHVGVVNTMERKVHS